MVTESLELLGLRSSAGTMRFWAFLQGTGGVLPLISVEIGFSYSSF